MTDRHDQPAATTLETGARIPNTVNPASKELQVLHDALDALQDVMAGGDGWGNEGQIYAIDDLREYLRLPPWCALCSWRENPPPPHTTYSHYKRNGKHWNRCPGPCEGCDKYEAEELEDA